jgi:hypothetical protein
MYFSGRAINGSAFFVRFFCQLIKLFLQKVFVCWLVGAVYENRLQCAISPWLQVKEKIFCPGKGAQSLFVPNH